ncbi:MAG: Co2+/Mg2+ efflux protein ApaG [Balneolaceae bacterium]|nr:Co2+/Mg2+ efflux protein ApaG [Balneolaceae bacterium]
MYQQTFIEISYDISVEVKPLYLEEESSPVAGKHVFAYFITIRNMSNQPVQLLQRHWEISDSIGEQYNVDGDGVIGKQPVIEPNGEHSYNSFCVLKSYKGSMKGYYLMEREDGTDIKVRIPEFRLVSHMLN